jgi:hypothetical protein
MQKEKYRKRALNAVKQPILQIAPAPSYIRELSPYRLQAAQQLAK